MDSVMLVALQMPENVDRQAVEKTACGFVQYHLLGYFQFGLLLTLIVLIVLAITRSVLSPTIHCMPNLVPCLRGFGRYSILLSLFHGFLDLSPIFAMLEMYKNPDYPLIFSGLREFLSVVALGFFTALLAESAYGVCVLIHGYRHRQAAKAAVGAG